MSYKSINSYIDELVDAVQDFDDYVGRSNGKIDSDKMKRYKKARWELKKHISELRRKLKGI